jgi:serine/threonine protein phosphatase PrpC
VKVKFDARTDIGLSRQFNEDCYLVDEDVGLYVVADGMGGSAGGEIASRMACDGIHRHVNDNYNLIKQFAAGNSGIELRDISQVLVAGIQHACAAIHTRAREEKELTGMGTTVVALLIAGEHIFVAHVGDSRLYLLRQGQLHQLTRDHSLVEELKKLGKISSSAQVKAKYRNAITRAVGIYETVQVDTLEIAPIPGDRFLLCTDGLHSTTTEEDLIRLARDAHSAEAADNLVRHANSKGGRDNITAILLDVVETEPQSAELTQRKISTLKSVPLFKFLSFDELLRVISLIEEKRFQEGDIVFEEKTEGDALYVLLQGAVDVSKQNTVIATLEEGDHFGELSLIDRFPRSATVTATRDCLCLVMSRTRFYDIIREYSALSVKLLWCLARVCSVRLRETTDELGLARSLMAKVQLASHEEDDMFGD